MRRFLASGLVAGVMVATMAFAAPAAQARSAAQSTSCNMSLIAKFKPGLDLTTEKHVSIKLKGKLGSCVGGGVVKAKAKGGGVGTLSCTSGTAEAKMRLSWNTGETSDLNLIVDLGAQTLTGQVVSGKFTGEDVTASNLSFTAISGNCVTSPLTKAQVTGTVGL